jgi:FKBP-type peptidyl-prolyl cis-trans isomerase 2
MPTETDKVSIRYTLTLEDGTLLSSNAGGDRLDYTSDQEQIIPAIEEAL